jgi:hypothetical protein
MIEIFIPAEVDRAEIQRLSLKIDRLARTSQ